MRVSYVSAVCKYNDAISDAIRNEIAWLQSTSNCEVMLFSQACDVISLPFVKCQRLSDLVLHPFFQASDVIVFHFGLYYTLFDALFVTPQQARTMVVFHNITPRNLLPESMRERIDQSFRQVVNILQADAVVSVSQTNLDVLSKLGISKPAKVIPLALRQKFSPPLRKPGFSSCGRAIELLFIGRMVSSKGVNDLMRAIEMIALRTDDSHIRLTLVGSRSFSDPDVIRDAQAVVQRLKNNERVKVCFEFDVSEMRKKVLLEIADIFVLPTYHEGFCVPIVEAISSGCIVVCYENSNTPAVAEGHARMVETGNVDALARTLLSVMHDVRSQEWMNGTSGGYVRYRQDALDYAKRYAAYTIRRHYLNTLRQLYAHGTVLSAVSSESPRL